MGVNELIRLEKIVISQLEQIRQNAAKIEKLTVNQNSEWNFVIRHLETVLIESDNLMLKTADALKQIKNLSGLSETDCEKQRSLILRLNMEYLQTLQRFSTAQRIGCRLFNRINDQVPHVSEQELRPVKQIEVKTYNREPIQVPKNKTIDRDRNKQWLTKEMQTAPIRSLNDFLFDATWNIPKFFDDDRLKNRLHGNLIYYQTNYFAFVIVCLIIIAIMFPVDFLIHFGLILIVYSNSSSNIAYQIVSNIVDLPATSFTTTIPAENEESEIQPKKHSSGESIRSNLIKSDEPTTSYGIPS
ncbi:unnamed protein product [Rotaria socialis]